MRKRGRWPETFVVRVAGLAVALASAAACSSSGGTASNPSGSPAVPATPSPDAQTSALSVSPAASPSASAPSPAVPTRAVSSLPPDEPAAYCRLTELRVSAGQGDAGLGHEGGAIVFTNVGRRVCELTGYPGVAAVDASGRQVAQARRTLRGYLGGVGGNQPPVVSLRPGQPAAAFVEGTDVPEGNATSCPKYASFLVTPPNETHSVHLPALAPGCSGLSVHPVLARTTGTQQPQ